jgi:hypothetical protein
MAEPLTSDVYEELFDELPQEEFDGLWRWQREVLENVAVERGDDVAIELATGAGKTLIALLVAEEFRRRTGRSVAYLTGNRHLTQQAAAEAERLGVPRVTFSGPKAAWPDSAITDYEFATAVGVMNFWNYFNESPGVSPAGLLILDDVHLAEGPLRGFFSVEIPAGSSLFEDVLGRIHSRFPYYGLVEDLLSGIAPNSPAEMLAPPDVLELAEDVRPLLDAGLAEGSSPWWSWQRIRSHCQVCCWLVSPRAFTVTPWIPPSETIDHFSQPERRLYLSATVGDVEDLRRRLGCRKTSKIRVDVPPRQGERWVGIARPDRALQPEGVIAAVAPLVQAHGKTLWLAARRATADRFEQALEAPVWRLEGEGEAAESFSEADTGHLVAAGRYDGMDFPGDACRLEVLPEAPLATSDLEEFISSYLRDAEFAQGRFAQRVAQALGRCNRTPDDRAAYLLWDPLFFARFCTPQGLALLPEDVRGDVFAAVRRGDASTRLHEAAEFLAGAATVDQVEPPAVPEPSAPALARHEVRGVLQLWSEDFAAAAESFGRAADALDGAREYRAFWLVHQATALLEARRRFGDEAAGRRATAVFAEAVALGIPSTFFSRLRACQARLAQQTEPGPAPGSDRLFASWDALLDRFPPGPQLEAWRRNLLDDLQSGSHDVVSRAIASIGDVLGHAASAPRPAGGEPDALWELSGPRRRLLFEVKLPERRHSISNRDVNQHEGAIRAAGDGGQIDARGVLITNCAEIDESAEERLEHGALLRLDDFVEWAKAVLEFLVEYGRGWSPDPNAREERRQSVESRLPPPDLLWDRAAQPEGPWIGLEE